METVPFSTVQIHPSCLRLLEMSSTSTNLYELSLQRQGTLSFCKFQRYLGEIGDVIVGRVIRVCQRKWAIDLNGQQPATLQLSAIYLPGGIQRRKLEEDELLIRQFFVEGDLISAEVQAIHADGSVSIHTRSVKYGKVPLCAYVTIFAALQWHFRRRKSTEYPEIKIPFCFPRLWRRFNNRN